MNAAIKISGKNLLMWSDFEDWVNGTTSAPTEHTLAGAGGTIARESTTVKQGTYSAAVTRVGADVTLYHDLVYYLSYLGRKLTFGMWVYATVASRARISLGDNVGTTNSSYHTGVAGWEFLTVTRNIDPAATRIRVTCEVNTGNTTAYFDGGILVEGDTVFTDLSSYLEDWKPSQKFRSVKYTIARRAGILIPGTEYGEKNIVTNGKVYGSTPTVARTNFDALIKAVVRGEKDLYLYDDRFIRAFLDSQDTEYLAALRVMKFSLRWDCQSPFSNSLQKYRTQQAIAASPTTFTVTNNGSAMVKPILQFVAGGTNITSCILENLTTGQLITFTDTVLAGKTLIIDCEEATVENDSVDALDAAGGDFSQFYLAPGGNEFKFTGSNCTIKVDRYDRWL